MSAFILKTSVGAFRSSDCFALLRSIVRRRLLSRTTMGLWASMIVVGENGPGQIVDISDAATVTIQSSDGPDGGRQLKKDVLRDGSLTATAIATGAFDVGEAMRSRFPYKGISSTWEWDEPQAVTAIDLFVADPPEKNKIPIAVKVLAKAPDGQYGARLYYTEDAHFKPAPDWQDSAAPGIKAQRFRIALQQPFVTTGLRILAGADGARGEVGDIRVLATTALPARASPPPAISASQLTTWFANPWADTKGGTVLPGISEKQAPWTMRIARNDTAQAMIGFLNEGKTSASVKVSLEGVPKGISAELLAVGAIERRSRKANKMPSALMNLFTEAQIKNFYGYFPKQLVRPETYADFPTLTLPPGKPVYVWLRLKTMDGAVAAGRHDVALVVDADSKAIQRPIEIDVLNVTMPARPVIQSWTYGSVNDEKGKDLHTTVNGGYKYIFPRNVTLVMGESKTDLVALAKKDPEQVRKMIREAIDKIYVEAQKKGYEKQQVLFILYDEPHDLKIPNWLLIARELKAYIPDARIVANPLPEHRGRKMTLQGTILPIAPFVDVWEPHLDVIKESPDVLKAIQETGKEFWFYKNVGLFLSRDETAALGFYRTAPWNAISLDMQGVGFWAESKPFGDMWNDFDRDKGKDWPDASIVFADEQGGALTTRNAEAWREGIEDVAIARMLQAALDRGLLGAEDRRAAKAWLENAPGKVQQDNQRTGGAAVRDAVDEALDILSRNWRDDAKLNEAVEIKG